MLDRLLETDALRLPKVPVGQQNPLYAFTCPVFDCLSEVILFQLRADALYFYQILKTPVDLDCEVAKGTAYGQLGSDFLVFIVA
jgi:hypothetical protein